MAQDMFLKLEGIEGEATDAGHSGEIELVSWNWEVTQPSSMHSGSGGGTGKARANDLEFVHALDKASPNLFKYCVTGKHIPEAVLTIRKAGGSPLEYLKLTMKDVLVTLVRPSSASEEEGKITETVRLSFTEIKEEYEVQDAAGASSGAVTAAYNFKENQEK